MNILLVASEAAPYLQTGDVAKVVTGLGIALRKQGHDARVIIPRYRSLILDTDPYPVTDDFDVQIGEYTRRARLWRTDYESAGLPVYLIENHFYFGRENPYGYLNDYERFIFFTRAIVEMLGNAEFQSESWRPEVIHGHDWSTGLLPMCLRHTYKDRFNWHPIAYVYTLHNVGFPGQFNHRAINVAGLTDLGIYESIGETPGNINFMARGILAADVVNTVSPRHAEEILNQDYDHNLAQALKLSKKDITGILNGLDYTFYNPAFDETITCKFDRDTLDQRTKNKQALQEECRLTVNHHAPLLGMICRLITEKGVGLLENILPTLMQEGVQVIIVGAIGDLDYRIYEVFTRFQNEYPQQFAPFFTSLDDPISHRLLAGADIMLIPSFREPCGSQQMLAMRYGALPVVHCTGGLADTVVPWHADAHGNVGKGFLFDKPDPESFLHAVRDALRLYRSDQSIWQELQRHNMVTEFSWSQAARQYLNLYKQALLASRIHQPLLRGQPVPAQLDQGDLLVQAILEVDELATTIIDQEEYLKQVASRIQELLKGDAVLIWKWDEKDPQKLRPEGYSFALNGNGSQHEFDPNLYSIFSEQDSRSWQYVHRLDSKHLGFLDSELARQHYWTVQLKAPMNTHGAFLGRIDVFSRDPAHNFSAQNMSTLSAFASTVAVNLEKTRLIKEAENLLAADREMAQEETVDKIAEVVLLHAKSLTHANAGLLRLADGRLFFLDDSNYFKPLALRRVEESQSVSPTPDRDPTTVDTLDEALDAPDITIQLRGRYSSKISSDLTNRASNVMGEINVYKSQPMAFSHNDNVVLQSLAAQAANVLQAAHVREQDDQSRVEQLRKLASSLVGGVDFNTLLERVVTTTAEALQAEAASLYLVDDDIEKLVIRAAYGYHKPLLKEQASYQIGEGTTGWIAQVGKIFKADSLEELHSRTPWKGKHKLLQEGEREPNVFLGIPLKVTDTENPTHESVIGVLKLEDRKPVQRAFTDQDMRLGEMIANVIATVIQNTRLSDIRLRELNTNLQTLSTAMVGGLEMPVLVQRIVDTIATVLSADASSLYLFDPGTQVLKARAGTGYQKDLVTQKASYELQDKGLTAWIAREGKTFKANNIEELHSHPSWAGKHTVAQKGREPNVFLGIPLKVITDEREEVIGVLKVEDIRPSSRHPERYFTDQDQLLVEMMGNVITTVIQNTRLSDSRLRELNTNLQDLSAAMVGGLEMSVLVQRIVETIGRVLGTDASSLYLIDPDTQMLKAQAGTGYQKDLVAQGASYDVHGEGLTAWIAREGKAFKANSIDELHSHSYWTGRYMGAQKGREPNVFLGIPLKAITAGGREEVIGVLKVEGVRSSRWHPEPYFTDQDQLLVEMMGNVITTVIQNTRLSSDIFETELSQIFSSILSSKPDMISYELFHPFVGSHSDTVLNGISPVLFNLLPSGNQVSQEEHTQALIEQTKSLLALDPNPKLFSTMVKHSKDDIVCRWYDSLYRLRQNSNTDPAKILEALLLVQTWQEATDAVRHLVPKKLHEAIDRLTAAITQSSGGQAVWSEEEGQWIAYKMQHMLPDSAIRALENLPMLFFQGSRWRVQEDLDSFRLILQRLKREGLGNIISVVSFLPEAEAEEASRGLRRELKAHAIDFIFFSLKDFQDIVSTRQPQQFLQNRLLPEISLSIASPYNTSGPTPDNMFFGREGEIREITDRVISTSYAVIGGRRIGKSSLLGRLHRVSLPDAGFSTLYHECSAAFTYEDFMAATISSWRPEPESRADMPTTFADLLKSPPTDRPLVLLLDEADKLIAPDRSIEWRLFSLLRSSVSRGHLQVVFSGEHTLRDALRDPHSPLFNFVNEKPLGLLDYNAVEELVTRPMKQLKIALVDEEEIVERIWNFTSGHPNVVQRLCSNLILLLKNRDIRRIEVEDVVTVIDDPKFQEDDFLKTYWERATPLERIISLLMAQKDKPYRLQDILDMLAVQNLSPEPQIEIVRAALDRLVSLRSILKQSQNGYEFAVGAFPRVLVSTTTAEDLLLGLKDEYIKDPI